MTSSRLGILLVEDDVDVAALVAGQLRMSDEAVQVDHVMDLAGALAHLGDTHGPGSRPRPDAVVLDLGLPDVPDDEPLAALRAVLAVAEAPPVVVLTGHGADLGLGAVELGAEDYLTKADLDRHDRLPRLVEHAVARRRRQEVLLARQAEREDLDVRFRAITSELRHDLRGALTQAVLGIQTARRPGDIPPAAREQALDIAEGALRGMAEQIDRVTEGILTALVGEHPDRDPASDAGSTTMRGGS